MPSVPNPLFAAAAAAPDVPVGTPPASTPDVAAPAPEAPSLAPAPEAVASPAPTAPSTFKVKVLGKETEVALDELQRGYIAQSTFTQRMQQLAEAQRKFEAEQAARKPLLETYERQLAEAQQYIQQASQFVNDREALKEWLQILDAQNGGGATVGQVGAAAQAAGMSPRQVQAVVDAKLQEAQARNTQQLEAYHRLQVEERTKAEADRLTKHYVKEFTDEFTKHKDILDGAFTADDLRMIAASEAMQQRDFLKQTGQIDPGVDETDLISDLIRQAVRKRAESLKPLREATAKVAALQTPAKPAAGAKLMQGKIAGAAVVTPAPKKTLKLGSTDMMQQVLAYVNDRAKSAL